MKINGYGVYMKKLVLLSLLVLVLVPAVQAVPVLQLYIDGATYDDATQTWITTETSYELYVIGMGSLDNVTLSLALEGLGETDDPSAASVDIDGTGYPTGSWAYGYAPLSNEVEAWNSGKTDLQKHSVYPSWYTEFGLGSFTNQGGIGNVNHDDALDEDDPYWLPTEGYISSNHQGWFQSYRIDITPGYAVHFDLYTLNGDGTIDEFSPFSHDASGGEIPEPATMLLFGIGLAGAGVVRKLRKR